MVGIVVPGLMQVIWRMQEGGAGQEVYSSLGPGPTFARIV